MNTVSLLLLTLGHLASGHLSRFLMREKLKLVPIEAEESNLPSDQWFKQVLDHSDPTNPDTWWQRYQYNSTWFRPGSDDPVFLQIGGEGEASAKWVVEGTNMVYAQEYHALSFQLEHRFYGKSHPKEDLSVENLRYLSSEQALADIANFIRGMNDKWKLHKNKWVVFGGSYSGSLAAWARLKYPHLIHAAVSTSGPLLALEDFKGYNIVVKKVLSSFNNCAKNVHLAAAAVNKLLKTDKGAQKLAQTFNLCSPIDVTNKNDVATFAEYLSDNIAGVVQYNKDHRILQPGESPAPTVDQVCEIMTDKTKGDLISRYAAVNNLVAPSSECIDTTYYSYIQTMKNTAYTASVGGRQWLYQTCTEFGFYQTSSSPNDLFGSSFNLPYFIGQCADIFGEDFDENRLRLGIKRSNIEYGALDIKVDRVVFVHGMGDPWHVLGLNKSENPESPVIMIKGTAHCANEYPPASDDPPQLKAAREQIRQLIGKWLSA